MKSKIFFVLAAIAITISTTNVTAVFAQERLRYDEYQQQLAEWQQREETAQARIQECEDIIAGLRDRLDNLNSRIGDTEDAIWRALGMTERQFNSYIAELEGLRRQIQELLNLDPAELFRRQDEVRDALSRIDELSDSRAARHPQAREILNDLRRLRRRLENALENAQPAFDSYSVVRGDYLWRISRKPDVYNDPFQWIRIYTKNRDVIKDPDLIYPGQEFKIFHDVLENEHLVMRGDNLSKIAGYSGVYNDPFQWTRLYELNQNVLENQDLIYPHMVLFTR
jgi:nucleoid-associated protein YgaU